MKFAAKRIPEPSRAEYLFVAFIGRPSPIFGTSLGDAALAPIDKSARVEATKRFCLFCMVIYS
jgi:hypothetical protein